MNIDPKTFPLTNDMTKPSSSEHLSDLLARNFDQLTFEDYAPLFRQIAAIPTPLAPASKPLSGGVIQFWDRDPDHQILDLLGATRRRCEALGVPWQSYDDASAEALLAAELGKTHVEVYRKCLHPVQRSDFFRYCAIYLNGGLWLDADVVMVADPRPLLRSKVPIFFQRTDSHGGLANGLLFAPPRHDIFGEIVEACVANMLDEAFFEEHAKTRNIIALTGIQVVNRTVAQRVHRFLVGRQTDQLPPIGLIDDAGYRAFVQGGAAYLGAPLAYKDGPCSWQDWCRQASGNPLDPAVQQQLLRRIPAKAPDRRR
ncbi:glycosyltransferase [Wenzhouxiangella limi]|nr:glycosyltransferase [Wenzhouxiangella limi]